MSLVDTETGEIVSTLEDCEAVIERGLATFVEVGQALLAIRDGALYRQSHNTFEDYCLDRWNFARAHAYRLMESAEVVAALSPIGDTPANEAQARALAPLKDDPEAMAAALAAAEAATNGKTTAAAIADAVQELTLEIVAERYPFLADCPAKSSEILATAKALDALAEGDERDRRMENARKWADMKRRQATEAPPDDTADRADAALSRALKGLVAWNVDVQRALDVWKQASPPSTDELAEWDAAVRIARGHHDSLVGLIRPRIRRVK